MVPDRWMGLSGSPSAYLNTPDTQTTTLKIKLHLTARRKNNCHSSLDSRSKHLECDWSWSERLSWSLLSYTAATSSDPPPRGSFSSRSSTYVAAFSSVQTDPQRRSSVLLLLSFHCVSSQTAVIKRQVDTRALSELELFKLKSAYDSNNKENPRTTASRDASLTPIKSWVRPANVILNQLNQFNSDN